MAPEEITPALVDAQRANHADRTANPTSRGANASAREQFRGVEQGSVRVAFVVNGPISVHQQQVRGVEVRGWAQALRDQRPYLPGLSGELIRIHPRVILSGSINPAVEGMQRRAVAKESA